ncbi:MAG TPA: M56 family metallopeptidase [Mycobacterium sp.]|nr:M56 family metallopeptidase [Mycobacterium sp.]
MTRLRPWTVARGHPVAVGVVAGVIAVQAIWMVEAACPRMTITQCLVAATGLVAGASALGVAVRASWLAVITTRALAAVPRSPISPALQASADRAGITRVHCLAGTDRTAFCAGLLRPYVYVTTATSTSKLDVQELDAILAHEGAHARRRDPLRRLLTRAAADVMFWFPLLRWWLRRHVENAEVYADKAAINHAGRAALAAALLAAAAQPPIPVPAMAGATQARIAHLLGEDLPIQRPPAGLLALSVLGAIGAVWLVMCLGQGALTAIGI